MIKTSNLYNAKYKGTNNAISLKIIRFRCEYSVSIECNLAASNNHDFAKHSLIFSTNLTRVGSRRFLGSLQYWFCWFRHIITAPTLNGDDNNKTENWEVFRRWEISNRAVT